MPDTGDLEKFKKLPLGGVISLVVHALIASQPDDGRDSKSTGPIEAYVDDNSNIVIKDGNHRFWNIFRRGPGKRKIQVRKGSSPDY